MLKNVENGSLYVNGRALDYIAFGAGSRPLVMIPGLGDAIRTVKGLGAQMSLMYAAFDKEFRVYMLSRSRTLPRGSGTRHMAAELAAAMDELGLESACVLGVSLGGMIAQYLTIDRPELVSRLVLAATACRPNDILCGSVSGWLNMASAGDYKELFIDTMEKTYSAARLRTYRMLYPVLWRTGIPKEPDCFITQAAACLSHDASGDISAIRCPTLVIGGVEDKTLGGAASEELAALIPDSRLKMYEKLGHAVYEEAPDFNRRVLDFFTE